MWLVIPENDAEGLAALSENSHKSGKGPPVIFTHADAQDVIDTGSQATSTLRKDSTKGAFFLPIYFFLTEKSGYVRY